MQVPPKIVVVGSLNIDYFARVERFPAPGETVAGDDLQIRFGGKGANQALAARGLGADVAMVGGVGADEMGQRYRERLVAFGVDVGGLSTVGGTATGSAFINVDWRGENTIVLAAGANGCVTSDHVSRSRERIAGADALVLQNEVPHEANVEAATIAGESGTLVVYNPAPWEPQRDVSRLAVDLLVVNEGEAAALGDLDPFPRRVITRGAKPTLGWWDGERFEIPTEAVDPVDTVGAGDAFVGAMAVNLAAGVPFGDAIARGNREASGVIARLGAQPAGPG